MIINRYRHNKSSNFTFYYKTFDHTMRKRQQFLTLLFCTFFSLLYAQAQQKYTINGTIKDMANGETLFGATVYLKGTTYGTTTNTYGFFSLTVPEGDYELIVSYIGYEDQKQAISLNKDLVYNAELKASQETLDEVIITADEEKKINIRKPEMSVATLKASTIKQIPTVLGEADIIKSIQLLPGVTNGGEGSGGFHVRGGAADQNLVLLDEAVIYNTSHVFGFFSVFNNDAIKDIKLYKGGIPAQFGGRASSVLDIRQKDGNNKNFSFSGGIGAISSRLLAEGPLQKDKGSFLVAGRGSYAHLFLKLTDNDNSAYFYDVNLKANYQINEKNRIYLSGYFGRDVFDFGSSFSNTYGNASANLRWNHIFNEKLFSNASLIYSKYNYDLSLGFIDLEWESFIENYHAKYDFKYYANDKITVDFGVSGIYYDFNPGEVSPSNEDSAINYRKLEDKKAIETGIYVSAEHKLTDKLTAQYGLRYSNFFRTGSQTLQNYADNRPVVFNNDLSIYERGESIGETVYDKGETIKTFGNFEPRLALAYQLNNQSSIKASYNRMAQYIHLISNTASITPLDVWAPSGKYIKPQLANQYAVGYFRNFKDNIFSLEVEAYYKTVDNRIDYIDGADLIAQDNLETEILSGEARAFGAEFLLKKNKGKFTGWLAYTLSKSEQRTPGGSAGGPGINNGDWYNTPYDRTHDMSFTGNYKLNEKWSFGANAIFQTGRPVTYPNGQYTYNGLSVPSYSDRNADRLPSYHRIDISATYTPSKNKGRRWQSEWNFGIYNIYNRKNAAAISFGQNMETGANEATRTAIFGIVPAVTYNFKF